MELSTARCMQVRFNHGPKFGTCNFDFLVSKKNLWTLGAEPPRTRFRRGQVLGETMYMSSRYAINLSLSNLASDTFVPLSRCGLPPDQSLHAAAAKFAPPGANLTLG